MAVSRAVRWPTEYSAVMPIPPCIWIASWPISRPALPTTTLVRDTRALSAPAADWPDEAASDMAAYCTVLRASSSCT